MRIFHVLAAASIFSCVATANANLVTNGDFELPITNGWEASEDIWPIGHVGLSGSGNAALFGTVAPSPDQIFFQTLAQPSGPRWQYDMLLAAEQPTGTGGSAAEVYLVGAGRHLINLKVMDTGVLRMRNMNLFGGEPVLSFSTDLNGNKDYTDPGDTLNVYAVRIAGDYSDSTPSYDVFIKPYGAEDWAHSATGLTDWPFAPAMGSGIRQLKLGIGTINPGEAIYDSVSLINLPEPAAATVAVGLLFPLLRRPRRSEMV